MSNPVGPNAPTDSRHMVLSVEGRNVFAMDSVSFAFPEDMGHIIVTGSHGGHSAGEYASRIAPLATVCVDAGFGKNDAGVAGLKDLDEHALIGIGVGHETARIGDALDVWRSGIVSYVNEAARRAGFATGASLAVAVEAFLTKQPTAPTGAPPQRQQEMARTIVLENRGRRVVAMDSISIVLEEDGGQIVIAGSNGGAASGELAIRIGCGFVALNDAGVGKDRAGIEGIIQMDAAGIPAVGVSHDSAEISNGRDTWDNGVVSYVNETARALGFAPGDNLREAVSRLLVG